MCGKHPELQNVFALLPLASKPQSGQCQKTVLLDLIDFITCSSSGVAVELRHCK